MPSFILLNTQKDILNVDEQNNTEKILQFIEQNPGCHLRQIKRTLNLSMGTLQYHLNLLEKDGKIISDKHSLHRNYFRVGMFAQTEKNLLKILNKETEREILMYIIEHKNPTQMDIVKSIQISAPSINWHINNMVKLGLITEERDGKFKRYSFSGNPDHVVSLMKQYHTSIWNNWSNRLAEMFLSFRDDDNQ